MKFYDKDKLLHVALDRGYRSLDSIAKALSHVFDLTPKTVKNRLSNGNLSKEECEVIGSFFEMTMKEYYDVFMFGLFRENDQGRYICKVDEPYLHLHPQVSASRQPKRNRAESILEELDKIE